MVYRKAQVADIKPMFAVRIAVKENVLNTPELVTDDICREYITLRGRGWVCEVKGVIVGFSIVDLQENSVWALFVRPEHEGQGIGKELQKLMLNWYFSQTDETIWLTTAPNTRAEVFYRQSGWKQAGKQPAKEVRLELTEQDWKASVVAD